MALAGRPLRFRNGWRLAGFLWVRGAIAVAGPGMVEWNMRGRKQATLLLVAQALPLEWNWVGSGTATATAKWLAPKL